MAIASVGLSMMETIAISPEGPPALGSSTRIPSQVRVVAGGMAVNAARACQKWGTLSGLVTRAGARLTEHLADEFRERLFLPLPRGPAESATCITMVSERTDGLRERSFLLYPGLNVAVSCEDLASEQIDGLFRKSRHVHFAGVGDGDGGDLAARRSQWCFDNPAFQSFLKRLRAAGLTTSMDFAPVRHRLTDPNWQAQAFRSMSLVDYLMPSEIEALLLMKNETEFKTVDLDEAIRTGLEDDDIETLGSMFVQHFPTATTIIKTNLRGCYCPSLKHGDGWIAAEPGVRVVDPTGAGDVFCGAFLTCCLRILDLLSNSDRLLVQPHRVEPADLGLAKRRSDLLEAQLTLACAFGNAAAADSLLKLGGGRELPRWNVLTNVRVANNPQVEALCKQFPFAIGWLNEMQAP
jgi:sugar/nucleoside kinase (ribokinase family)